MRAGSVIWSKADGLWHMWASEMLGACGLNAWACNSQVVHATSTSLDRRFARDGPLTFGRPAASEGGGSGGGGGGGDGSGGGRGRGGGVVQPRFAHEPNVVRAPTGEWVMFYTGCDPAAAAGSPGSCSPAFSGDASAANCTGLGDGSTPPGAGMLRGGRSNDHTWMSWSKAAAGPWSAPVVVLAGEGIDSNLSPVINSDGTLLGLWRGGLNSTRCGSFLADLFGGTISTPCFDSHCTHTPFHTPCAVLCLVSVLVEC